MRALRFAYFLLKLCGIFFGRGEVFLQGILASRWPPFKGSPR